MFMRALLVVAAVFGLGAATAISASAAAAAAAAAAPVMVEPIRYAPSVAAQFVERYGERERPYLTRELSEEIGAQLGRAGAPIGSGGVRLETEVLWLQPNLPTRKELSDHPSLSPGSFRRGGVHLRGRYVDAEGRAIATFEFNNDYLEATRIPNAGPWNDVLQGFEAYARRAAKVYEQRVAPAGSRPPA